MAETHEVCEYKEDGETEQHRWEWASRPAADSCNVWTRERCSDYSVEPAAGPPLQVRTRIAASAPVVTRSRSLAWIATPRAPESRFCRWSESS